MLLFSLPEMDSVADDKFLFIVPITLLLILVVLLLLILRLLLLLLVKPKFWWPWLLLLTDDEEQGEELLREAAVALKVPRVDELFGVAVLGGLLLFAEFPDVWVLSAVVVVGFVVLLFALRKSLRSPNILPVPPMERISLSSVRNPLK